LIQLAWNDPRLLSLIDTDLLNETNMMLTSQVHSNRNPAGSANFAWQCGYGQHGVRFLRAEFFF